MTRRVLISLPVKALDLENALHSACDSGHWEGEVQVALDKSINQYRLELVYDDNAGPCPHQRRVIDFGTNRWYLGCVVARDKDGFSTPCTNCGRLPCERYNSSNKEKNK